MLTRACLLQIMYQAHDNTSGRDAATTKQGVLRPPQRAASARGMLVLIRNG